MNQDDFTIPRAGRISDHNRRNFDSQIATRFEGTKTWSKCMANKYHGFPECQDILNTVVCYLNPTCYSEEYLEILIDSLDPYQFVSAAVLRSRKIYHHTRSLIMVTGINLYFPRVAQKYSHSIKSHQRYLA